LQCLKKGEERRNKKKKKKQGLREETRNEEKKEETRRKKKEERRNNKEKKEETRRRKKKQEEATRIKKKKKEQREEDGENIGASPGFFAQRSGIEKCRGMVQRGALLETFLGPAACLCMSLSPCHHVDAASTLPIADTGGTQGKRRTAVEVSWCMVAPCSYIDSDTGFELAGCYLPPPGWKCEPRASRCSGSLDRLVLGHLCTKRPGNTRFSIAAAGDRCWSAAEAAWGLPPCLWGRREPSGRGRCPPVSAAPAPSRSACMQRERSCSRSMWCGRQVDASETCGWMPGDTAAQATTASTATHQRPGGGGRIADASRGCSACLALETLPNPFGGVSTMMT
jgi:hypothetical protein